MFGSMITYVLYKGLGTILKFYKIGTILSNILILSFTNSFFTHKIRDSQYDDMHKMSDMKIP